jgi:hypothetical protein
MRKTTENARRGAVLSAAVVTAGMVWLILGLVLLWRRAGEGLGLLLGLYILIYLSVAVGVLAALRQRLREIRGGEEDDAKKY